MTQPKPQTDIRLIGVTPDKQAVTFDQFNRSCIRNDAPLTKTEAWRVYYMCNEEHMDAGVILAMAAHEGRFGRSPLQTKTNNALNIRAMPNPERRSVYQDENGATWYRFETWRLGLLFGIYYLKNEYGGLRGLSMLSEIVAIFAPVGDGANNPRSYTRRVLDNVEYMRTH